MIITYFHPVATNEFESYFFPTLLAYIPNTILNKTATTIIIMLTYRKIFLLYKIIIIRGYIMDIRIKYFEGAKRLEQIEKGNWIDVYSNVDVFIPLGVAVKIPLGFALELPKGFEGHMLPRSSTYERWGIISPHGMGIIDDTYIGDNDQWHFFARCDRAICYKDDILDETEGTWIRKGDKIAQFRIQEAMPKVNFIEVESFGNPDRGGFGTTGGR